MPGFNRTRLRDDSFHGLAQATEQSGRLIGRQQQRRRGWERCGVDARCAARKGHLESKSQLFVGLFVCEVVYLML